MVGMIEGFRWAVLGGSPITSTSMLVSCSAIVVVLVLGMLYFRRVEGSLAEIV
jgi:lipopolysaccharide transport system permease protein